LLATYRGFPDLAKKLEDILAAHGCAFRPSGRFEILTHCPQCGDADQSEHLAISTRNRGWRCLRNPRQHRGRSYVRLLTLLLRCSTERAQELLGVQGAAPLPAQDEYASQWRRQLGLTIPEKPEARKLSFPREFRQLAPSVPRSGGFWDYLMDSLPEGRGFSLEQARWAAEAYDLHYAVSGTYAYRLIIPIYDRLNRLMTWTARAISPEAHIRYKTLSKEFARAAPGELLLGLPLLETAPSTRCLVIVEGPFDAIAISAIGHSVGVWGACVFGLELSDRQADIISELNDRFDKVRLMLDPDASLRVLGLQSSLPRRCKSQAIPDGFKDPGEFVGSSQGEDFVLSLAK
jgi:hypothetical protein